MHHAWLTHTHEPYIVANVLEGSMYEFPPHNAPSFSLFIITYICIHRPGIPPSLYVNTEIYIDMAHTGLCACIQVTSAG